MIAEKRAGSALLDVRSATEKLNKIDTNIACAVAGITSDANTLIEHARVQSQRYLYTYQEHSPVEHIVDSICSTKQSYTQFGGLRPFGVSFLIAGWDKHLGFQLYQTDPSGNYSGWRARSIGSGTSDAQSLLKEEYKEDAPLPTIAEALELAVKVIAKTMNATTLTMEKVEAAVLSKEGEGDVEFKVLTDAQLQPTLDKVVKEIEEKKNKEASGDI